MEYLLIIALNLAMYLRTLRYGYMVDDDRIPKKKGRNFLYAFILQFFALEYFNVKVERLTRISLHIIASCLIYVALGKTQAAFWAALLYSVHPINNQNVAWINAGHYTICNILVLLMWIFKPWAVAFYLVSLVFHMTPAFAPLLFGLSGWYMLLIYMVIIFLARLKVPFLKVQDNATMAYRIIAAKKRRLVLNPRKIVFALKTYAYYFRLVILPLKLGIHHDFGWGYGLDRDLDKKWNKPDWLFWEGLLGLGVNIYFIITCWGEPLSFGLLWFHIFIVQWCNFYILHQEVTERYASLASIGIMYALASLLPQQLLIALFVFYLTKMSYYLPGYKDWLTHLDFNLREFPRNSYTWNLKGFELAKRERYQEAIVTWEQGVGICPLAEIAVPDMLFNIGKVSFYTKNNQMAKYYLRVFLELVQKQNREYRFKEHINESRDLLKQLG